MEFYFEKHSDIPVYAQLANHFRDQIIKGLRKPGEKLPTERELSISSGLSRGTVKMAYKELIQSNLVYAVQGSGSFVSEAPLQSISLDVCHKLDCLLAELAESGFSDTDIDEMLQERVLLHRKKRGRIRAAWVECCPELLEYGKTIATSNEHLEITPLPLSTLGQLPTASLSAYDIILTAGNHEEEIVTAAPCAADAVVRLVFELTGPCIIALAKISSQEKVAVWSVSPTFLDIMHDKLGMFHNLGEVLNLTGEANLAAIEEKLQHCDVLIVPPEHEGLGKLGMMAAIGRFAKNGGEVIRFAYQLDRGSFIHLEEKVNTLLEKRARQGADTAADTTNRDLH